MAEPQTIDVTGIFQSKAGRAPTEKEISDISAKVDLQGDPALAVSGIQSFAEQIKQPTGAAPKIETPTPEPTAPTDTAPDIDLGAFGSIGGGGAFTLDIEGNKLRGITDEQMRAALTEAEGRGLQVDQNQLQQLQAGDIPGQVGSTAQQQLTAASSSIDTELQNTITLLDNMGKTLDARLLNTINDIKSTFERRRRETETLNKNTLGAQTIAGIRAGRQRFAPELQTSILAAEENAGIQRLTDIDVKERSLINEAIAAKEDNDFELLNQRMNALSDARREKTQAILDLHKISLDQERLALAKNADFRDTLRFEQDRQEFFLEQEDRVAEALASGFVDLDENFNVIEPNEDEIRDAAERLGISPEILIGQVNDRIDEVKQVGRQERGALLDELRFSEQIEQNRIGNEFEQQRLNISNAKLALDQQKFSLANAKTIIDSNTLSPKQAEVRDKILDLSAGQQEAAFSAMASFKNANDILDLLDFGVPTGPLAGRGLTGVDFFGVPITPGTQALGISRKEQDEMLAAMTAFSANFIKSISGVAVSAQEFERLMSALPGINRQESVNRNSLKSLLDTVQNKYELQLGVDLSEFRDRDAVPPDGGDEIDTFLNSF